MIKYYEEQGIETHSIEKLIHVKLTNDLKIVDTEGNNVALEEINPEEIIYLDFDFSKRKDEFKGGEAKIETDLLILAEKES
ncbi:hypothetical protein ACJ2A9_23085 [Anaerobacillus sp. MEB173]|uniref:hypothetical protein n=1 Tax=Anaerobacillus sp. MEB173 TaxID=3383345 RepID=UPI003F921C13